MRILLFKERQNFVAAKTNVPLGKLPNPCSITPSQCFCHSQMVAISQFGILHIEKLSKAALRIKTKCHDLKIVDDLY